ncbi:MAG TPA: polysaccharide biosynthesis tyrosine autokinase [Chitinivibrionales bacterium]|nr:polysaccharide biosynthesis tyrosine autokinase [Chitinivibrionales bacterium]
MKDKDRRKFRLGDIIQKLNEAKAASGEPVSNEPDPATPEPPAPSPVRPRMFPRSPETAAARPTETAPRFAPEPPPATFPDQPPAPTPLTGSTPAPARAEIASAAFETPGVKPPPAPAVAETTATEDNAPFDIMQYVGVLVRRKNIIILVSILAATFALVGYVRAVKLYTAHARMLFSPGFQDIMSDNISTMGSWNRDEQRFNTHLALLKSETLLKRVCKDLGAGITTDDIQTDLKVTRGSFNGTQNDIVDIVFRHAKPETARDVVNQICREYIDYMRDVNVSDLTNLITKLEDQIGKMEIDVDNKENALREFKEKNRTVELSQETNITVSKLSNMELALQQTDLDMMENRNRLGQIKKEIDQQDINVIQSLTYSNPFQAKLADLELQLNSASAEYSPEHFKVRMIKNQIDKIKEALKTDITKEAESRTLVKNPIRESLLQEFINLTIEKSAADTKHDAQAKIIQEFDRDLYKLPTVQLQFAQLTRETESTVGILKLLKSRYEEAKIKRDSQESDLKILEWAPLPLSGKSSMSLTNMLLYLLIGIVIGIVLAFLVEFLDQSIKDPQQVERSLEVPLLGIVPLIEMDKGIIDSSAAKWKTILEPFRALRATLKHLASTQNIKTFLICSAVKGEGKTTLAANISITFALDGKKVILVDGDLRRAQMHTLFNLPKKNGLADYLTGASDVNDVLKKTVHENLLVITAGEHPQNPAELIGSVRFDELVKTLRAMADYVIIDSPALLPVSDGLSMAPKVDACIMLVRALWTPLKAALQAKGQLKRIGCSIMGAVLNGISHSRGYYPYYYGYYRYYSYQYAYEEGQDRDKKFAMREFGLAAELKMRNALEAIRFSFPHYTAVALNFAKHLLRRKTFWVLLAVFLLLPLLPVGLGLFGIQLHNRAISYLGKKPDIQYLSTEGRAGSGSGSPLEEIAAGQKVRPTDSSALTGRPVASGIARDSAAAAAQDLFAAISDSLRLWEKAFNEGDAMRYFSFYDSTRFMYPSGGFREWVSEKTAAMKQGPSVQNLHADSMWADTVAQPFYRMSFVGTCIAGSDTARRQYSIIWQRTNSQWRIVREKYGVVP